LPQPATRHSVLECDVCVVGGGSGGIGAAVSAARLGADTILIEKEKMLGGTSTLGGVSNWEPVAGATGLPRELFLAMQVRDGACILSRLSIPTPSRPVAEFGRNDALTYEDTCARASDLRITFEPEIFHEEAYRLLEAAGAEVWLETALAAATHHGNRIEKIQAVSPDRTIEIRAHTYIDCTADVHLVRMVGAVTYLGPDPRARFGEESAEEQPRPYLNGVTLIYRVTPTVSGHVDPLPAPIAPGSWKRAAHITELPGGDRLINPLPTLLGTEYYAMELQQARKLAEERTLAHWHWLQTHHGYDGWRLRCMAPLLGVREGPRTLAEKMLTEKEVIAGLAGQDQRDIIAICDHPIDFHGGAHKMRPTPLYGVPFGCLIPKGWQNLLVACRGAGFSHLAGSSCRLSRTMMTLGQAAGTAAALTRQAGTTARNLDPAVLRETLRAQGVTLEAPAVN